MNISIFSIIEASLLATTTLALGLSLGLGLGLVRFYV